MLGAGFSVRNEDSWKILIIFFFYMRMTISTNLIVCIAKS